MDRTRPPPDWPPRRPGPQVDVACRADERAPAPIYRSEAFAEDLLDAEAPSPAAPLVFSGPRC